MAAVTWGREGTSNVKIRAGGGWGCLGKVLCCRCLRTQRKSNDCTTLITSLTLHDRVLSNWLGHCTPRGPCPPGDATTGGRGGG
eukprot:6982131-Pyramimonas_sp.AAC.1